MEYRDYLITYQTEQVDDKWISYFAIYNAKTREVVTDFRITGGSKADIEEDGKNRAEEFVDKLYG